MVHFLTSTKTYDYDARYDTDSVLTELKIKHVSASIERIRFFTHIFRDIL